jgi:hypothetical protein
MTAIILGILFLARSVLGMAVSLNGIFNYIITPQNKTSIVEYYYILCGSLPASIIWYVDIHKLLRKITWNPVLWGKEGL